MKYNRNKHFFITILITVFCIKTVSAQHFENAALDSLKQVVHSKNSSDINKVNACLDLSEIYIKENIDSAIVFAEKGKLLAEKINYKKGIAVSLIRDGEVKEIQNEIEEAKKLIAESIRLYEELEEDDDYLLAHNLLGFFYESQVDLDKALEIYLLGLKSAKTQNNQLYKAFFLNNISVIYSKTGKIEESFQFILEASAIFEKLGRRKHYGYSLVNIGIEYQKIKQYDKSLEYLKKAEKVFTELDNHYGLMQTNGNLASIAEIKGEYTEVLDYNLKALNHALLLDDLDPEKNYRLANIHNNLGNSYLLLKNYASAIPEFQFSLKTGKKINSLATLQTSYKGIYASYLELNKMDSASHYLNLFLPLNDSLIAEQYNQKIDELNYNYQLDIEKEKFNTEKELLLYRQNRQRLIYLSILTALFSLVLIIVFLWYVQKNKLKKSALKSKNLKLEKENLALALERKNKELITTVLHLIERNKFISEISDNLEKIESQEDAIDLKRINDVIRNIDINSNKRLWKEFELRYIEVHGEFFYKLSRKYSKLTSNDRRLCALIILNMSTKDISSITYQSEQSIKIARYRLRKKLGLEKNENLTSFLHSI